MTNESDTYAQAEPGKAPGSTFERKKMSIKTLRKRIALVAVAALAVTGLSTVPANAAVKSSPYGNVSGIALTQTTVPAVAGASVTVTATMTYGTIAAPGGGNTRVIPFNGILESAPSGGSTTVTAGEPAAVVVCGTAVCTDDVSTNSYRVTMAATSTLTAGNTGTATFAFTPQVAGTYVMRVWHDTVAADDGATDGVYVPSTDISNTISIVVAAAAGYSNSLSTSVVTASSTGAVTGPLVAGRDDEVRVSRATGTDAGTIKVTVLNTSGAAFNGTTVEASVISGPGLVLVDTTDNTTTNGTFRSHSVELTGANVAYVHVNADGNAGTGTVQVSVKDTTTGAVLGVLSTETFYFFATVAKLTATALLSVARAGTAIGCVSTTACSQAAFADTPFVVIKAEDSAGNLVPGLTVSAVPANTAAIGSGAVGTVGIGGRATLTTRGVTTDLNGLGYYNASLTGATGAASGSKSDVTFRTQLADGSFITSNAITASVGGSISKETVALDKATYTPGEPMIVTRTAVDSSGNPVYDGQSAAAVTFSKAVGGSVAASEYIGGKKATSATAPTVFAPVVGGPFTAIFTNATTGVTATTAATVSDPAAAAMDAQFASLVAAIAKLQKAINKINKRLNR